MLNFKLIINSSKSKVRYFGLDQRWHDVNMLYGCLGAELINFVLHRIGQSEPILYPSILTSAGSSASAQG
jgi:hypothetical protein